MVSTEDIPLDNAVVLVPENSDDKLILDEQTVKKLNNGDKTVIKFQNGMFLGCCEQSHRQCRYEYSCMLVSLSDDEKTALVWQFDNSTNFLYTTFRNSETEQYRLDVHMANFEVGTMIHVVQWSKNVQKIDEKRGEKYLSEVFVINEDSISPQGHPNLYLGRKDLANAPKLDRENYNTQALKFYNKLQNDGVDHGKDTLGVSAIARCLANHITSTELEPPFVLGIFGEWGAGKSFCFNLIQNRLIEMQKEKMPENSLERQHVGHIYCVNFSAWTFHKECLWSSLMYKIFSDISHQMEIERLVGFSKEGGVSPIEINAHLERNQLSYLKELPGGIDRDDLEGLKEGFVSKSFGKVFAKSVKKDKECLEQLIQENTRNELKVKENMLKGQGAGIVRKAIFKKLSNKGFWVNMLSGDCKKEYDKLTTVEVKESFLKLQALGGDCKNKYDKLTMPEEKETFLKVLALPGVWKKEYDKVTTQEEKKMFLEEYDILTTRKEKETLLKAQALPRACKKEYDELTTLEEKKIFLKAQALPGACKNDYDELTTPEEKEIFLQAQALPGACKKVYDKLTALEEKKIFLEEYHTEEKICFLEAQALSPDCRTNYYKLTTKEDKICFLKAQALSADRKKEYDKLTEMGEKVCFLKAQALPAKHKDEYDALTTKEENKRFFNAEALAGKTLEEFFEEHFSFVEKFMVYIKSIRWDWHYGLFIILFIIILVLGSYLIWTGLGNYLIRIFSSLVSFTLAGIATIYQTFQKGQKFVKDHSSKFSGEWSKAQDAMQQSLDIEMAEEQREGMEELEIIRKNKAKINEIKKRLKVLEGQSVHDIVKNRVASDDYEPLLGIVHRAQKDLEELNNAMFNASVDILPRGIPRVVLNVDDLDRCDPKKVVDVLEALQLLVKNKLFVAVVAIDSRYVCLSLEKKKYRDILSSHSSPTGMDFMEKIIQVPYRLPPIINRTAMSTYVTTQIAIRGEDTVSKEGQKYVDSWCRYAIEGGEDLTNLKKRLDQQTFTSEEANALEEACVHFRLTPRAAKRIVNVLKLIKEIHILKNNKPMDKQTLEHTLLLLVMAASNETKVGIQKVFRMMESSRTPNVVPGKRNLMHLVKENCKNVDDFSVIDDLDYSFEDGRKAWEKISDKFLLARSFSFVRHYPESRSDKMDETSVLSRVIAKAMLGKIDGNDESSRLLGDGNASQQSSSGYGST